jgi:hypothetical protein
MGIVIVIPADEAQAIRSRETDDQPTLQQLQDIVDGYIEIVPGWADYMGKPCVVYCNEDGKARGLSVNRRATAIWWQKLGGGQYDDVLCGDIVLVVDLPDKDDDE